ncbi:MAG: hypothetical protein ACFFA8_07665 [Promethearchaeota archaeon]
MLFQNALTLRIITISLTQIWPIIYTLILAYKVIKRARNQLTYTLFSIFTINSIIYILPIFSVLLIGASGMFAYAFYIIPFFLFIFNQGLIVIFTWLLTQLGEKFSTIKIITLIIIYSVIASYVFWFGILFQGIRYDSETGWIPTFSLQFAYISWILSTIVFTLPELLLSIKIIKTYEGKIMRKRIRLFLIGMFLEFVIVYNLILYNTWVENQIFRILNPIISLTLGFFSAYFIYKGFGKGLN